MTFWHENGTKILGWLTLAFASVQGLITINAFDGLLSDTTIRWMGIVLVILTGGTGSATINRGHVNTAQIKVADAITTALNTPPPKQGGFARVWMLAVVVVLAAALLSGCATNIDQQLSTGARVHAAATRSVAGALDAHVISSKDAEAYQEIAVNSSEILDSARDLKDTDPTTAEGKVQLANGILRELQDFLVKQLEKQP